MNLSYYTCDVFTEQRFGGNPLAVVTDARGLSDRQMQQIAREFSYSESAFVLPSQGGHTRRVRIFTPMREVPFAGHPNVGTAFVLASTGAFGPLASPLTVTFEEQAGVVPVTIHSVGGRVTLCELSAPQALSLGRTVAPETLAAAVSLAAHDVAVQVHLPQVCSVGLPFLLAELKDRAALARARADINGLEAIGAQGIWPSVFLYTRASDSFDLHARMFAPLAGVPEDPATGSANCALVGMLAQHDPRADADLHWRISQGVEMGRPSSLLARVHKANGELTGIRIGGACVLVCDGTLHVDDEVAH